MAAATSCENQELLSHERFTPINVIPLDVIIMVPFMLETDGLSRRIIRLIDHPSDRSSVLV